MNSFLEKQQEINKLLDQVTKSITINIAASDLDRLKSQNRMLCFAKKVDDDYTVIWTSMKSYTSTTTLSWTPLYAISGTNTFEAGIKVETSTNSVPIALKQISTLKANGLFQPAVNFGKESTINMHSDYVNDLGGGIHVVISQCVDGITKPIYVSKTEVLLNDTASLTPKEFVSVWFEENVETSTMISTVKSDSYEFDLTTQDSASISFENSTWVSK